MKTKKKNNNAKASATFFVFKMTSIDNDQMPCSEQEISTVQWKQNDSKIDFYFDSNGMMVHAN